MKHSKKILLIETILMLVSLFCFILFDINYYLYLLIVGLTSASLYLFFKPPRNKERFDTDIVLIIVISLLFYYAITYFIGFFSGFYYTSYSKQLVGILTNIITAIILIVSVENIRELLIKNNAYHKSIIFITPLVCLLLELPSAMSFSLYSTKVDFFNAFLNVVVPLIAKNITLTYIVYKSNKYSSILYQILLTIPNYLVPVFPNLGDFFSTVINTILPIIILVLALNITTVKFEKIKNSRKLGKSNILELSIHIFLILTVLSTLYLTSNMFRFTSLAIGSNSMAKVINKGDIVIIDKKQKDINKNDVIAYDQGGRIIVHRVVDILEDETGNVYITKGDANESSDGWTVNNKNLTGKVLVKIKWLGWPTVKLSELLR